MVSPLQSAERIVVKIGSALLVDTQAAKLRDGWLDSVSEDIAAWRRLGIEVIIVSSGAIALARTQLNMTAARLSLAEKQAAASVGQILLAQAWSASLAHHGLTAAQLLLTSEDTENRERHLNARSTLRALLRMGCVPVINENDAIAFEEIRFGDNDRLAARVAQMVDADTLILLSDIDGLYTQDPRTHADATHIPLVEEIDDRIRAMGGNPPPGYSSGGMKTKLIAADIATQAGARMAIARGNIDHPLRKLSSGARATWFSAHAGAGKARKKWIMGSLRPSGTFQIDAGAVQALRKGSSLLAVGVQKIDGQFPRNALVTVTDPKGAAVARGLTSYSSEEAQRMAGQRSAAFPDDLAGTHRDALIHRDDLVMLRRTVSG
ncbi:Glutamate 5-kinase [Acetobacteraceae bacterium EV16G]|uniref:Glutamate 5-kinase n=1 Tax=Sorlinia euscelidii TaxID=3081148 RepID=A0ABU7U3C6_9PROT